MQLGKGYVLERDKTVNLPPYSYYSSNHYIKLSYTVRYAGYIRIDFMLTGNVSPPSTTMYYYSTSKPPCCVYNNILTRVMADCGKH